MNIKSLLLGSAAVLVAATGARAADAIVIAEPEPMEYVRICDMYDGNFFYIPGTETCMDIGGYIRYEMNYRETGLAPGNDYRFYKFARFAPTFDVRNETEWGTLRGFAEIRVNWTSGVATTSTSVVADPVTGDLELASATSIGSTTTLDLNHAFIELQQGAGVFRIGKGDTPYARFLGYGGLAVFDGSYGFNNSGEVSYTFNSGNFSAVLAAIEVGTTQEFEPAVEGGVNYNFGPGSIGAMAGYDMTTEEWGAKAVGRVSFAPVSLGVLGFYSSGPSIYAISNPAGGVSEFSVLGYAHAAFTPKAAAFVQGQWFDGTDVADDTFQITGGFDLRPVSGLRIRPEVQYTTEVETWAGVIRFDRSF